MLEHQSGDCQSYSYSVLHLPKAMCSTDQRHGDRRVAEDPDTVAGMTVLVAMVESATFLYAEQVLVAAAGVAHFYLGGNGESAPNFRQEKKDFRIRFLVSVQECNWAWVALKLGCCDCQAYPR